MRVETAFYTIRGERWMFQSFDHRLGENAERDRIAVSPAASFDPPVPLADASRGAGQSQRFPGPARFSNLLHPAGVARG